ncbi:hypothetical protein [Helicobacter cappadocius]|uniref:Uncharacterized protein n=1 Tax=Helicobacter cappadocius TaxID=3063998 RepID=A0AA90PK55_9HELI|nr:MULTISPECIES: hypothetical protein [unclassified Helicobacter]MDO7253886.1 hypothetical protein [Helicobacter sp. faydin-H75]MDP2539747.1 hypothetical protein [Helicobacter sp. faydin-H76]
MKKEMLAILKEGIELSNCFKSVDFYERYAYEDVDFPVCVIKNPQDNITQENSGSWKIESVVEIDMINDEYEKSIFLTNCVLKAIDEHVYRDSFLPTIEEISTQSEFSDTLLLKTTINLKVVYYCKSWQI